MKFDYSVHFNVDDCIKQLGFDKVQPFLTNSILMHSEPYMPFDTGALVNSGHIENETDVVWKTPYARRWYYANEGGGADRGVNFQGAPIRGAYWVDRMLNNGGMEKIESGIRSLLK